MSDETNTLNIGGINLSMTARELKLRKKNKETGKHEEYSHVIVTPAYTDVASALAVFQAILQEAEKTEAGNAVRLTDAILTDRIKEASDESINAETGETDTAKYKSILSRHARPRSAGQGKEALNQEIVHLTPEMIELNRAARKAGGWQELVAADGTPRFADEATYLLRLEHVGRRMTELCRQIEVIEQRNAAAAAKREQKAKDAAALAQQAAAATAK